MTNLLAHAQNATLKSLSVLKSDKEGQMSDLISDSLFRITVEARLHCRGGTQVDIVLSVLSNLMECRGDVSS